MINIYGKNCIKEAVKANKGIVKICILDSIVSKEQKFIQLLQDKHIKYEVDGSKLKLNIPSKYIRSNHIYFKLKYELPRWVEMSSCDSDRNVKQTIIPKTFNFKYFVNGLAKINNAEYITKIDTLKFK